MTIFWAVPPERNGAADYRCFNSLLTVAAHCGHMQYNRIAIDYTRTDNARNMLVQAFLTDSKRDDDTLVMLDSDHDHPADIVTRLAAHPPERGVVGALAYRRGEPYNPLFFLRDEGGTLRPVARVDDPGQVYKCAIVSTSAMAIRRWVFLELAQKGYEFPYFRYEYPVSGGLPSEDMYFGRMCEFGGVWHWCDTSIVIPHATIGWVTGEQATAYQQAHPMPTTEITINGSN